MSAASVPVVSVVVATRDRAACLGRLLACIKRQDIGDFECIVVDDGSNASTIAAYDAIWRGLDKRFVLHPKAESENGGGPSRMRNKGIRLARGRYVAFCDDDDRWLRDDHLSTAVQAMTKHGADLFFAAMQTSAHGVVSDPDLYGHARASLERQRVEGEADIFLVSEKDAARFLRHRTLHSDTLVAERRLLFDAGLYWEKTNLAEDRDLSLRIVDRAARILFRSTVVGDLDVSHHASLYRTFAIEEKALFASLATLHSEIEVASPRLRRLARAIRAWDMLDLAGAALADGRRRHAREFGLQSFLIHPTLTALRLVARSLVAGVSRGVRPCA